MESFIEKSIKVHGTAYDYSKVDYVRGVEKVSIICRKHGIFEQIPASHIRGRGCPECGYIRNGNRQRFALENFISISKIKHGDVYDYSKSSYTIANHKIIVICPKHGEFSPQAKNHMLGHGCNKCAADNARQKSHRIPLRRKIRLSCAYKKWRKEVFVRDNYICKLCGEGGKLHADHIKPFSIILDEHNLRTLDEALSCEELWDINNGRTLCVECHKKTDTFGSSCKKNYKKRNLA